MAIEGMAALLRHSEPDLARRVLERCPPGTRRRLLGRLSDIEPLIDRVLAEGDHHDRVSLAGDDRVPRRVLGRFVALGCPEVNRRVFTNSRADTRLRRRILAEGPELHPALYDELLATRARPYVLALVYARDVELVRHSLSILGEFPSKSHVEHARLQAFATLWRLAGPDAVRAALGIGRYRTRVIGPVVRDALESDDGRAVLDAAVSAGPDTGELIRAFGTDGLRRNEVRHVLGTITGAPDWDAIAAAHRGTPFTREVSAGLAGADGCPVDTVAALASSVYASTLPLEQALINGVATPRHFLATGRPAWRVLGAVETFRTGGSRNTVFERPLEELRPLLPDDAEGWRRLAALGPAFPGSVRELLAAAREPGPDTHTPAPPDDTAFALLRTLAPPRLRGALGAPAPENPPVDGPPLSEWTLRRCLTTRQRTPDEILHGTRPAAVAMAVAGAFAGELAARHLRRDADAWTAALALLPDFTGTVAELLETAAAMTS
ncbi:hypothetical protein LO772_23430 [Yinghuangia sp. ASG 101]|uniref:hypothetical protein n=1 Tax=Yinghuangia sp. ASG 101 TaxID=2896848 RepID=UPI001E469501|nr:hypothetical protein [Yinghuangia sp. ASG 101]UGQ09838.1 hypothetical protein LO772_23430 [Yinghuangia sp. ASG 101]